MKNKTSGLTKTELRGEILSRMNALDTSGEEYSNQELLKEFEGLHKRDRKAKGK